MKTVSILGCGWLGFALAQKFKKNHHIKATTTSQQKLQKLQENGLEAFLLSEVSYDKLNEFLECDILIIAVPPSKFKDLKAFISTVLKKSHASHTLFISSSSVYDNVNQDLNEEFTIKKPINKTLFETEQLFDLEKTTILRCAGLMGFDRVIGKYSNGKLVVQSNKKTNYIHQTDVINAIAFVLEKQLFGTYNLCSKVHYSKEEIYTYFARKFNFIYLGFECSNEEKSRTINSEKLRKLGFEYLYDDPKLFYDDKKEGD